MGGGDKGLLPLGSGRVIDHVIARLAPQCGALAINANGDPARFADFGLPVLADPVPGQPGPLAGILAAMDWAAGHGAGVVVTAASDTPSCRAISSRVSPPRRPVAGPWPKGRTRQGGCAHIRRSDSGQSR